MKLLDDLKKALKLKSVVDGIRNAHGSGFDFKLAGKKFLMNFAIVCSAVAGAALADYFTIPSHVDLLFQWLPESVRTGAHDLLAPAVAAAAFALKNWAANRKNEIVWVVPVAPPTPLEADGSIPPTIPPMAVPIAISAKPSALGPPAPSGPLTVTNKDSGA